MTTLDALIVGAGPTGLTLANELLRHGASCRVVEALAEPVVYSKAAVIHARTMELCDAMGVAADVVLQSKPLAGLRIYSRGETIARVSLDGIESAYPHVYGISQRDTERILAEHLQARGGKVERATKLEALENGDDGVSAIVSRADGSRETIRARFLVGCDGAHSTVRHALGFTFDGSAYEIHLMQADVHVDFPARGDGDEILAFLSPAGPLAMFPLFKDGRYRVIVVLMPGAPDIEPTLDAFQKFVDERGPKGATLSDPAWMVPFRIHCRRTNHYRDRSAFIAGDAAHVHSPAGGQGMNTGMQDACNLAWKLALVARGRAKPSLLDSYEAERQPIAKDLLAGTDALTKGLGVVGVIKNPIVTEVRNKLLGAVSGISALQSRMRNELSMLALSYEKSPIVKEDRTSVLGSVLAQTNEAPSLADWAAFGDGPRPGDRAPDVHLAATTSGATRASELFRGTKHTLLLFDGAAATAEGYARFDAIAKRIASDFDDVIAVHVVVPYAEKPAALAFDRALVFDADGALHKKYGARSECLYLVRPDQYVGYRAQPADEDALVAYLHTLFS